MRIEDVPFPKPGVLYAVWLAEDRSEGTYVSVHAEPGLVVHRITQIGVDGVGLVEEMRCRVVDGASLQQALEQMWADQCGG